jgi:DNA-binding FadR family transcriptional regulator
MAPGAAIARHRLAPVCGCKTQLAKTDEVVMQNSHSRIRAACAARYPEAAKSIVAGGKSILSAA